MNGVTHRDYKTQEKSKWQGDRNNDRGLQCYTRLLPQQYILDFHQGKAIHRNSLPCTILSQRFIKEQVYFSHLIRRCLMWALPNLLG